MSAMLGRAKIEQVEDAGSPDSWHYLDDRGRRDAKICSRIQLDGSFRDRLLGSYWDEIWKQLPDGREVPLFQQRKLFFLTAIGSAQKVLDLGCGDGVFTQAFAEAGIEVVGADLSSEALSRARDRCPGIELKPLTIGQALPFEDAGFDSVVCSEVIGQVVDTQSFFSEARRVLAPRGRLLLTTPYNGKLSGAWIAFTGFERHHSPFGQQLRFYTKRSLKQALEMFGFEVVALRTVGGPPLLRQSIFAEAVKV